MEEKYGQTIDNPYKLCYSCTTLQDLVFMTTCVINLLDPGYKTNIHQIMYGGHRFSRILWRYNNPLKCPYCHYNDSKVIDSRDLRGGESIRRRRECLKCGHRFTTYERVEPINILVIKKDGNREEYSRLKLSKGIITAFTKRPMPAESIEQLIDEVEGEIFRNGELEVNSRQIGELVMQKLLNTDPVAFIRFASVYREFANLEVMRSEIDKLAVQDSQTSQTSNNGTQTPLISSPVGRSKSK